MSRTTGSPTSVSKIRFFMRIILTNCQMLNPMTNMNENQKARTLRVKTDLSEISSSMTNSPSFLESISGNVASCSPTALWFRLRKEKLRRMLDECFLENFCISRFKKKSSHVLYGIYSIKQFKGYSGVRSAPPLGCKNSWLTSPGFKLPKVVPT